MNTDSTEYDILIDAVKLIVGVEGFTCEIGVREGGSTKMILDMIKLTNQNKIHVAIDPYGNIDYCSWETRIDKVGYTNKMKQTFLKNLYSYCYNNNMECLFFPLEDTEFFKRYSDGIPIYNEYKTILNKYSLVFFDGPHSTQIVKTEFDFFKDKVPKGGVLIFDDINQYPHMANLDPYIQENNFRIIKKGNTKISYKKI